MNILVLGGNGFIGRSIVNALKQKGLSPVIASRKPVEQTQIAIKMHCVQSPDHWLEIIRQFDVVINSVGILRERGWGKDKESYERVHTKAVAALAQACAVANVRLIHISTFGLSASAASRFIRSKWAGEQAIFASNASTSIVRVSLLDGEGGYGAKWFRRLSKWPVQFVMSAPGMMAPLQVSDLGDAVASLTASKKTPQIVELGGADELTIAEYLTLLRASTGRATAIQLIIPKWFVRLASHLFDVLNWTPLSYGHYELMQGRNVPVANDLPRLLGRSPRPLGEGMPFGRLANWQIKTVSAETKSDNS